MEKDSNNNRIKFLDGFRGLAILMVILYHAFARWVEIVPYKKEFSDIQLFSKGFLGVKLFFLISGFVILMTLEKSQNFKEFVVKRWLRLFPAMLFATVLIYISSPFLGERPLGIPKILSVIPGLLFIEPNWISGILNTQTGVLEMSFWSLFVEVKFYFIFGLLFFYKGEIRAIVVIFSLFLLSVISQYTAYYSCNQVIQMINNLIVELSFSNFGWFATGSFIYLYFRDKKRNNLFLIVALISGFVSSLYLARTLSVFVSALLVLLLFISTVYFEKFQNVFSNKVFVYLGFISYPLYLIHENALIALVVKMHQYMGLMPGFLLPVIPIAFLILISHIIAKYIEPKMYFFLKTYILPTRKINV